MKTMLALVPALVGLVVFAVLVDVLAGLIGRLS